MFKTIANAWKIPDVRKKIIYTLMMLAVYRLGCFVPVPGVNIDYVSSMVANNQLLGMVDLFSGGALKNITFFALGIIPYINASIIMNLLTIAIPSLEKMAKEGEEGRKKIASITRYAGVILGLITSIGIIVPMGRNAVINAGIFDYVVIVACLTAGTALIMWIGERITEKGIGNGISLLIFLSIVSRLGPELTTSIGKVAAGNVGDITIWSLIVVVILAVVIVTGITFVDMGERRIPVQYAKRVVGRKVYGGQSTHLPIRINQSGVMPLIFAITLVTFPAMIAGFWPKSGFYMFINMNFNQGTLLWMVVYALLIIFFTFFYTQVSFNPIDVSKNMQQYGGFIPGIRPGKPTSDYLRKILNRVTFFGAIFLALIATVPAMFRMTGVNFAFGATSLLIMVNVALETSKQLESQMMMRHYKGFLK